MVTISKEAAQYILDILDSYDDKGPTGEGWQSEKLLNVIEELETAIKEDN